MNKLTERVPGAPRLWSLVCVAIVTMCLATACTDSGGEHDHDHDHSDHTHGEDDHSHDHDHDHGHGERVELGKIEAAGVSGVAYQFGKIEAGQEAHLEVEFADSPTIDAVRVWYGDKSGRGAMKSKADLLDSGAYHVHVEVKEGVTGQLWFEVETPNGRESVGFAPK